jgi:putative sigma-54 modulation protein
MLKISVKSVHFHADAKLVEFIEKKLGRLNRYFSKAIEAEVHLKLQDIGGRIQEKWVEVRLHIPGNDLVDKKSGKSFEAAASATVDSLKRQLVRHKEKVSTHGRGVTIEP